MRTDPKAIRLLKALDMECKNCGIDFGSFDQMKDVYLHIDECEDVPDSWNYEQ